MNREELNKIFEETVQECREILFSKNMEYSRDSNALENFDVTSAAAGITELQALYVFLRKHINSIETYIREGETYSDETIQGRVYDCINYLILFNALLKREELRNKTEKVEKDKILFE